MALFLDSVNVHNDDSGETYRLVIKDGDKIVGQTDSIHPTQGGSISLAGRNVEITRPLTLIAERLTPAHL